MTTNIESGGGSWKEECVPVTYSEVAGCWVPDEGRWCITIDLENRTGQEMTISLVPEVALDLAEDLKKLYWELKAGSN